MSDSESRVPDSASGQNRIVNAIAGTVILLAIVILVNYVFGQFNPRLDLTDNKIYTLTEGTEAIIEKLKPDPKTNRPGKFVSIRFYGITDSDYVSQFYLAYTQNVEDLLTEYEKAGDGMIDVQRLNPEPFSDDLKQAKFDNLRESIFDNPDNPVYCGIVVECEDRKEVLPFLPARPEELLEYDLTRSILRAADPTRKKVRIMTTMQVGGGFSGGFNAPPARAWFLVQSLRTDYDVEFLEATTDVIPEDTDALVILHPYDVGEETQFAIDQYLLKGGRILATVDPNFYAAQFMQPANANPMMAQMGGGGGPAPSSNLNKLLSAWGVEYSDNQVLADATYQTRINTGYSPTVLSVGPEGMADNDPMTARLNDVFLITPGAFEITEKEGIQAEALVESSEANQLVSAFEADPTQRTVLERLQRDFQPHGKKRVFVARLSGEFQTAFPEGKPSQGGPMPPQPGPSGAPEGVSADDSPAEKDAEPEEPNGESKPETDSASDADAKSQEAAKPAEEPKAGDETKESETEADSKKEAEADAETEAEAEAAEVEREQAEADGEAPPPAEAQGDAEDSAAETPSDAQPEPAPSSAASSVKHLKKSEKEGLVFLFADMDFLYDQFCAQMVQNQMTGEIRPANDNLALFENALELAAGGSDLVQVRSRSSNRRPFSELNKIQEKVRSEFIPAVLSAQAEVEKINQEKSEIGQKILGIVAGNQENMENADVQRDLTEQLYKLQEQEEEIDRTLAELEEKEFEANQRIKEEFERVKNGIILLAIGVMPALVAIFGIAQAITRRARTAAR